MEKKMEGWKKFEGKKVFVILKNKRNYSGEVVEVSDEKNGLSFLTILDKFNQYVTFVNSEIEVLQEERA